MTVDKITTLNFESEDINVLDMAIDTLEKISHTLTKYDSDTIYTDDDYECNKADIDRTIDLLENMIHCNVTID